MKSENPAPEAVYSADEDFEQLTLAFLGRQYVTHPVMATLRGVHDHDDTLDSFQRFALREDHEHIRAYLHAIDKISLADLSLQNRMDYRIARCSVQQSLMQIERQRWTETQPYRYLDLIFYGLLSLISRDFADAEWRGECLLGRLLAVPQALADAAENLHRPPRLCVEAALENIEAGDAFFTETLPAFFATLEHRPLREALTQATALARNALGKFAVMLREIHLPNAPEDFALGRELFDYALRVVHLMDEDADSLLHIGEAEIKEAQDELAVLAEKIESGIGWQEQVAKLKTLHPSAPELVSAYRTEMQRAKDFVEYNRLVTLPDDESLCVVPTPAFARPLYPYAAYVPPAPFEEFQEGTFWVTPIPENASPEAAETRLQDHSRYAIPIIALHEGYPGHHVQMSRANRTVSSVRRHFADSNLMIEGWAMYCEDLMWEQGFFTDPRIRLMQLKARLWRACRVVLDVRIHTRTITLPEAAQVLQDTAKLEAAAAHAEVRRYALTPTQPMTYIMGRRALRGLRDEAQRRQGARFNLRRFHDQILSEGSLPPSLLAEMLFAPR